MRLLIMINSSHVTPYDLFMKAQQETWDAIQYPNINTMYFHGTTNKGWVGKVYASDCPHGYFYQHWKFKQALDAIWDDDWDFIYKTHSSSYIEKDKLYSIFKKLLNKRLYGGWLLGQNQQPIKWNGKTISTECVAGCGVFLSRDVAGILRCQLPEGENIEEDVLQGRLLQFNNQRVTYVNNSRVDMQSIDDYSPSYHYRIKSEDRLKDVATMYALHKKIMQCT